MLFAQSIIVTAFVLQQSITFAAPAAPSSVNLVVGGLEVFTTAANNADDDVKGVNAVNGATTEPAKIVDDINQLSNILGQFDGRPVTATNDVNLEEQVTDAFNAATQALVRFLSDLQDKAGDLNELGQGSGIEAALTNFRSSYRTVSEYLLAILLTPDSQNTLDQTSADGYGALSDVQAEFTAPTVGIP